MTARVSRPYAPRGGKRAGAGAKPGHTTSTETRAKIATSLRVKWCPEMIRVAQIELLRGRDPGYVAEEVGVCRATLYRAWRRWKVDAADSSR
jgi:hypothetical protein